MAGARGRSGRGGHNTAVFDTHCHLTHARFAADLDDVVARARAAGLGGCMTIGTGVEDARAALRLTARFPGFVSAAAAIDPFSAHRAGDRFDAEFDALEALVRDGGFRAIGECGLDYHYDLDPRPVQRLRLERHLALAGRSGLPVVIHVREAHEDMLAVLAEHPRVGGVIHSFTSGPDDAARYLALGWSLAFNGVVTYKNAPEVREAARIVPAGRLLTETDGPYLAPVPLRGRRCEPAHLVHTVAALSEIRGEPVAFVRDTTVSNAARVFPEPAK